ncbi:type II toxin-antitoxin system RelE/ParE family toxin [Candidatus Woesearchaeota archaeon]|nr:type II toxin-antitoxin system RelE/ParE family toxin [Candidatus Woesearchaeota archaeon]
MNINILPAAKKSLRKLPREIAEMILRKLYSIKENPLGHIERLKGSQLWKLRIGDYRAIMMIDTGEKIMHIVKIGHRKDIYKRL